MANDYIVINVAKPLGGKAVQAANQLLQLRSLIDSLVQSINHLNDGVTYTTLEAQFGLAAGVGANFATLMNIQQNILVGSTGAGGATQQGQIIEFCARIAGQ